MSSSSSPTDHETPPETLARMGATKVRLLFENGGLPQYLHAEAVHWLAEQDAKRTEPPAR
jgi:hypothetical protein